MHDKSTFAVYAEATSYMYIQYNIKVYLVGVGRKKHILCIGAIHLHASNFILCVVGSIEMHVC